MPVDGLRFGCLRRILFLEGADTSSVSLHAGVSKLSVGHKEA